MRDGEQSEGRKPEHPPQPPPEHQPQPHGSRAGGDQPARERPPGDPPAGEHPPGREVPGVNPPSNRPPGEHPVPPGAGESPVPLAAAPCCCHFNLYLDSVEVERRTDAPGFLGAVRGAVTEDHIGIAYRGCGDKDWARWPTPSANDKIKLIEHKPKRIGMVWPIPSDRSSCKVDCTLQIVVYRISLGSDYLDELLTALNLIQQMTGSVPVTGLVGKAVGGAAKDAEEVEASRKRIESHNADVMTTFAFRFDGYAPCHVADNADAFEPFRNRPGVGAEGAQPDPNDPNTLRWSETEEGLNGEWKFRWRLERICDRDSEAKRSRPRRVS